MRSLLHSATFTRRTLCLRPPQHCRHISNQLSSRNASFETLGLDRTVVRALGQAFPNIQHPTAAQVEFIPAVLQGKDVLLKGETGTGKSFGLVLALLSQGRNQRRGISSHGPNAYYTTSLVITPHRDLAYQFMHWIGSLLDVTPNALPLESIAQVLLRKASVPIPSQLQGIRDTAPQILIATPQAVLEAMSLQSGALDLRGISTVVVDEADYLLESVPTGLGKQQRLLAEKRMLRHPAPTRQILDIIYGTKRIPASHGSKLVAYRPSGERPRPFTPRPQLVMSSATLRASFRSSLLKEGWLTPVMGELVKIGEGRKERAAPTDTTLGNQSIVHCAVVVSDDGEAVNIPGSTEHEDASAVASASEPTEDGADLTEQLPLAIDPVVEDISQEEIAEFASRPCPFNEAALEAIAAAFAVDVPRVALLVLPANASVRRAVFDLRMLGVNAHGLDVLDTARGGAYLLQRGTQTEANPTLLVSTLATTRGLDLPDLTHVFVLGVTEALTADAYLHVAGRVGRFGKSGKVVAILEARQRVAGKHKKDKMTYKDEPRWMSKIYKAIGVTPAKLPYFGDADIPEVPVHANKDAEAARA